MLAEGTSTISGLPDGDDTQVLVEALSETKCLFQVGDTSVSINGGSASRLPTIVDARLAGTTSRFVTAIAALSDATTIIDGQDALRGRPMSDLHDALRTLGAEVTALGESGHLPVSVSRGTLRGGEVTIRGDVSSQFISALMLIAPALELGIHITIDGPLVSRSYVQLTASVMREFGAIVVLSKQEIVVLPGGYSPATYFVQPDFSSAAFPVVAAVLRGGSVRIEKLALAMQQGDSAIMEIVRTMGAQCDVDGDDVVVRSQKVTDLKPLTMNMNDCSDLVPVVAVLCACAKGISEITGVGFIRNKESDRLGDVALELEKCGIEVEVLADGLRIVGGTPVGAVIDTHHDHRLAMAFSVLSVVADGMLIQDSGVISKSWPNFFEDMSSILGASAPEN
jgi:3-phosphoshikimate 1-carboxyvinyltransferase